MKTKVAKEKKTRQLEIMIVGGGTEIVQAYKKGNYWVHKEGDPDKKWWVVSTELGLRIVGGFDTRKEAAIVAEALPTFERLTLDSVREACRLLHGDITIGFNTRGEDDVQEDV